MSLNWKELELLLSELPLEGSYIQKITEHDIHSFTFSMYSKSEKAWLLYFEIATPSSRVVRTDRMRKKSATMQRFTQYLRAHIEGRKVTNVHQLPYDRAFILTLENSEDRIKLLVRLFSGIGANAIVLSEDDTILELMYRRPQRGEEKGKKLIIEKRTSEGDKHFEVREWEGDSFNSFIDRMESEEAATSSKEALIKRLSEKRDRELHALEDRLRRQKERYASTAGFEASKTAADTLASYIHLARKGMESITLDGFDGSRITIPLDPALSPEENLEKLYQRYRKDRRTSELAKEEIERTEEEIESTRKHYDALIAEGSLQKLEKENARTKDGGKDSDGKPGVRVTVSGWDMIIGRTAKENDHILRRETRGSDIWMHTRDFAGAYVIIKAKKGKTVPLPVLLDAASLAIHYSKAKKNGRADLYYTEVKYLRRAKDGKTGLVIPTQERNLHAVLDEKRVKEILG